MSCYVPDAIEVSGFPNMRFFSKPFDLGDLLEAVATLLQPSKH